MGRALQEEEEELDEPSSEKGTQERTQTTRWSPAFLKGSGFRPRTIVDVGAAYGTPQLYEAFPASFHILIEPLREYEPHLQDILEKYEGEYLLTAVGARDEKAIINVEPNMIMSSIHERTDLTSTGDQVEKREIPITTLDTLMKKHNFQPPFGLKIDTEGYEYQVIEGASNFLRKTEFVVAEVSVAKRFIESYSFPEFTEIMHRNGFFLWDILHIGKNFVDAVFRRRATRC
jgi:FkbM family methyltransferase